jgi:hypothetical protein
MFRNARLVLLLALSLAVVVTGGCQTKELTTDQAQQLIYIAQNLQTADIIVTQNGESYFVTSVFRSPDGKSNDVIFFGNMTEETASVRYDRAAFAMLASRTVRIIPTTSPDWKDAAIKAIKAD